MKSKLLCLGLILCSWSASAFPIRGEISCTGPEGTPLERILIQIDADQNKVEIDGVRGRLRELDKYEERIDVVYHDGCENYFFFELYRADLLREGAFPLETVYSDADFPRQVVDLECELVFDQPHLLN